MASSFRLMSSQHAIPSPMSAMFGNDIKKEHTESSHTPDFPVDMSRKPSFGSNHEQLERDHARPTTNNSDSSGRNFEHHPQHQLSPQQQREFFQRSMFQGPHGHPYLPHMGLGLPPHQYMYQHIRPQLHEESVTRESSNGRKSNTGNNDGGSNSSNKRKEQSPMMYPSRTPSPHGMSPSMLPNFESDMYDRSSQSSMFSNDGRIVTLEDGEKFQPRPSSGNQRARREFVPNEKKDNSYWCKRIKNNDSARRSRVKRKALEKMMESRLLELQKENIELKHELEAMERRFNCKRGSESLESDGDSTSTKEKRKSKHNDKESGSPTNKMARDDDLERASEGSDDSGSNDDSRMFSVSSVSALQRSLGLKRDRVDSFNSTSSSLKSHDSGRSSIFPHSSTSSASSSRSSPSNQPLDIATSVRLDKTGALDLTGDHSNRSTPPNDSSDDTPNVKQTLNGNSDASTVEDTAAAMKSMKNFPLKCRWKRELQSAQDSTSDERRECQ